MFLIYYYLINVNLLSVATFGILDGIVSLEIVLRHELLIIVDIIYFLAQVFGWDGFGHLVSVVLVFLYFLIDMGGIDVRVGVSIVYWSDDRWLMLWLNSFGFFYFLGLYYILFFILFVWCLSLILNLYLIVLEIYDVNWFIWRWRSVEHVLLTVVQHFSAHWLSIHFCSWVQLRLDPDFVRRLVKI